MEKDVHFEWSAAPGSRVFVVGTFNNWNPTANPLEDNANSGHFETVMRVLPGTHEFKFVVNGDWLMAPQGPDTPRNRYGVRNSVIHV